jgi:hypothetical protein
MTRERESAQYIADMILELRNLAKSTEMPVLQGLLEITYYEAYALANPVTIPENEEERLHAIGEDVRRFAGA